MSDTVVSVSASNVDPIALRRLLNQHLVYDRARLLRGRIVRFLIIIAAMDTAMLSVRNISPSEFWWVIALVAVSVGAAFMWEHFARHRFDQELCGVPQYDWSGESTNRYPTQGSVTR